MASELSNAGRVTLIFDGDCAFCNQSVQWLNKNLPAAPPSIPYQWANLDELGLTVEEASKRVWLVVKAESAEGLRGQNDAFLLHQYGGYLAISMILRHQPGTGWRFLGTLMDTPPFSIISGVGYWLIARFRYLLPGGTPACKIDGAS